MGRLALGLVLTALPAVSWAAGLFTQTNPHQCLWDAKRQDAVSADNQAIRRQLADCMAHAPNAAEAARVLGQAGYPGAGVDHVEAIRHAYASGRFELAEQMLTAIIMGTPRPCVPGYDCPGHGIRR